MSAPLAQSAKAVYRFKMFEVLAQLAKAAYSFKRGFLMMEPLAQLAKAAYIAMRRRIKGSSRYEASAGGLWMAGLWARFGEPEMAEKGVLATIARHTSNPVRYLTIDYDYGIAAIIAEMLLQSHNGVVRLLPALPKTWPTGHVKGLCARGGFEVDIAWKDGKITKAAIKSKIGKPCRVRAKEAVEVVSNGQKIQVRKHDKADIEFETEPGRSYILTAQD